MRSIPGLGLICRRGRVGFIFFWLKLEKWFLFPFFPRWLIMERFCMSGFMAWISDRMFWTFTSSCFFG